MTWLIGWLLGYVAMATIAVAAARASVVGIVASLALACLAGALVSRTTDS